MKKIMTLLFRPSLYILILMLWSGIRLSAAVTLPEKFIIAPDQETELVLPLPSGMPERINYELRNYRDALGSSGTLTAMPGNTAKVSLKLPPGYYTLNIPAASLIYGLAVVEPFTGKQDAYFGVDAVMAWETSGSDRQRRERLVAMIERCGIQTVRDRLRWADINPRNNEWQFNPGRKYQELYELYRSRGLQLLLTFHDAPRYLKRADSRYPEQLLLSAAAWSRIMSWLKPYCRYLEVWNEPDIDFGNFLPADQYVPLVKTLAFADKESGAGLKLGGGVTSVYRSRFMDTAAANGMLQNIDFLSFHTYVDPYDLESLIGLYRRYLVQNHCGGMPLWLTESGALIELKPKSPPGCTTQEDIRVALYVAMKAVEGKACGLDKYFPFIFTYWESWNKTVKCGMLRPDDTPARSYCTYAVCIRELAGKKYLGDLVFKKSGLQRARVFAAPGSSSATIVLYTGKTGARISVPGHFPIRRVCGIDGSILSVGPSRTVDINDGIAYIQTDSSSLGGDMLTDTTAMALVRMAADPTAPDRRGAASPVVICPRISDAGIQSHTLGYRLVSPGQSAMPVKLTLVNLSSLPQPVALKWQISSAEGKSFSGNLPPLMLKPQSQVAQSITLSGELQKHLDYGSVLTVTPTENNILPAALVIDAEQPVEKLVASGNGFVLPIKITERWRGETVTGGKTRITADTEKIGFDFELPTVPKVWGFVKFALSAGDSLDGAKRLVIRARCSPGIVTQLVLWEGNTGYVTAHNLLPPDGQWHNITIDPLELVVSKMHAPDSDEHLTLKEVNAISIGTYGDNTVARKHCIEIADLVILR